MEIVVNDTNILIDLYNARLLSCCKQLDLDFRTLDLIIEEIEVEEQLMAVNRLVSEGILKVCSLSGQQLTKVFEKVSFYDGKCNLSPEDISVMVYAQDNHCRLLTGDKTLREKATLENVTVSGILFLTDMITRDGILEHAEMINALERLLQSNGRLPKRLIQERIEHLRSQL